MTPSIQSLMMKLQRYDYVMMYTPVKQLFLADVLSRSVQNSNVPKVTYSEGDVTAQVNLAMSQIPASDKQLQKIATVTEKDRVLYKVIKCLRVYRTLCTDRWHSAKRNQDCYSYKYE